MKDLVQDEREQQDYGGSTESEKAERTGSDIVREKKLMASEDSLDMENEEERKDNITKTFISETK